MFQIITDPEQMDKLWKAGLLWYRVYSTDRWVVDTTDLTPSRNRAVPYAILVEE